MPQKNITAFEIVDHGWDHAQYFQGTGVSFTEFEESFLGAGSNAKEAYEEAADYVAGEWNADKLPKRPRGIRKTDRVRCECGDGDECEHYYYVSIRVR